MIGQWGHFLMAEEKLPYAIDRDLTENIRLFEVLGSQSNLVGDAYSIADMMSFPWAKVGLQYLDGVLADRLPDLSTTRRWMPRSKRVLPSFVPLIG